MPFPGLEDYPPALTDGELQFLISEIKDWQITHGSLLKLVGHEEEHTVPAIPIGTTLFPTLFPRECYNEARALQPIINRLYATIAKDDSWLETVLRDLIENDEMIGALWAIHSRVKEEVPVQDFDMGIFRSDYMLHVDKQTDPLLESSIKQVEVNTFSVAGGTHANIVSDLQQFLGTKHTHILIGPRNEALEGATTIPNDTIGSLVASLEAAHRAYERSASEPYLASRYRSCVLFVVQPRNINICDERPIEYGLWAKGVPAFRVTYGAEVLDRTRLNEHRQLLYTPPWCDLMDPYEVSVVYMRAGYDAAEYSDIGVQCRTQLERSRAIKCPSIACHLATLKRVQQALTVPGALERFLPAQEAARLRETFMPMYRLDDSPEGIEARQIAMNPAKAIDYVLKPSLEGGGHNVYGSEIVQFLSMVPEARWQDYGLMQLITPPTVNNTLISPAGLYKGPVASELGIFGTCLWRNATSTPDGQDGGTGNVHIDMMSNDSVGWSFKTKSREVDEMSVVKGYGCFDTPLLIPKATPSQG